MDFNVRWVSKPMHPSQNGEGLLIFRKVAEKEVKTERTGELSLGRPRQSAESSRRSGCSSSLRACGVQVARAALGGRRREEGGMSRWKGGGGGGSGESGPGFAGSPRAAFRAPARAGAQRRRRRQRRRSLSGDVEAAALAAAEAAAAARAGVRAQREEQPNLAP